MSLPPSLSNVYQRGDLYKASNEQNTLEDVNTNRSLAGRLKRARIFSSFFGDERMNAPEMIKVTLS